MKAAVLKSFITPLFVETLSDPHAGPGEAVANVAAAPVISCAKEVFDGSRQYPLLLPLVPGCGAIGKIESLGPDATRLRIGDWVFCDPTVRFRDDAVSPDLMRQGWNAYGKGAQRLQAHFRNGPFAERMCVPIENAARIEPLSELDAAYHWSTSRWTGSVSAR